MKTPIYHLDCEKNNDIYLKREDLFPFSFGGNKARKAMYFFEEIDKGDFDTVVTYGSSSSNHARIVANLAKARGMSVYIICPKEASNETSNSRILRLLGAEIIKVDVEHVAETIDNLVLSLKEEGKKVYFIQGGGHGNLGTRAYIDCYKEISEFEKNHCEFDYIFLASGTGTTQAGLVLGKLIKNSNTKIIGISIARNLEKGRNVVIYSIKEYCTDNNLNFSEKQIEDSVIFLDDYICGGYGKYNSNISEIVKDVFIKYGVDFNTTYTGKAFWGMKEYLIKNNIHNKKILFINTGGTPLFFDFLNYNR